MAKMAVGAGVGSNGSALQRGKDHAAPSVVVRPTLAGLARIGAILTVDVGRWNGVPRPSFSMRWQRDGVDISGATGPVYAPVVADDGARMRCIVTAVNRHGTASAASEATRVVHTAPVYRGGLSDRRYARDAAIPPVDIKPYFNGENLVFKAEDLPEGLRLDEGVISGVPRTLKASAVVISAANSGGEASGVFNVVVFEAAAVPDAFSETQWSVASSDTPAGDAITVNLTARPADGGLELVRIEYRIDGGSWTAIGGTATGDYAVSGLVPGATVSIELRAVNAAGAGPASDVKTVTPVFAAPIYDGGLSARSWTEGVAIAPYATAGNFSGSNLRFAAAGLPEGLVMDAAGVISGAPSLSGSARVTVTATNSGGVARGVFDVTIAAASTAPVVASPGAIAGTPRVGETLRVAGETVTGTPAPAIARQWTRNGADIPGAVAPAYTLTAADDGAAIACRIAAANIAGADSAATASVAVTYAAPTATGGLADRAFVQGSGPQNVAAAGDFSVAGDPTLSGVTWSVSGGGATISAAGVVTIPTGTVRAATAVTVTATNSGGSASSAFSVTVNAIAAGGLKVDVFRSNFTSDAAYKSAFVSAFDDALRGTGPFAAARAGDVRRINIDGVVNASFETGTSAIKAGLEGCVEVIGTGVDTTRWFANQHLIHGGDANRNVDVTLDGFDISMGSVNGALPDTLTSHIVAFSGKYRVVSLGRDAGFNRYTFSMGGTRDYDLKDMRNTLRRIVVSGVTSGEFASIAPKETVIGVNAGGKLYETRVEDKQDLGGGRVRLWLNGSDAGENRNADGNRWHQFYGALSVGATISWLGGSATCDAKEDAIGRAAHLTQVVDCDWKELHFYGLAYNAGEARWTADDLFRFSGVMDGLGTGDYWKIKANAQRNAPKKIEIKRAVNRFSTPGRGIQGAHSDLMQIFDNNYNGAQNVLFEFEDVFFGLNEGAQLGQRPQGFGSWGNPTQITFAPGSYLRNSFVDLNANSKITQEGFARNLAVEKLCLVGSGFSGHDGFGVFTPILHLQSGCSARNCLVAGIRENGAPTSNIQIIGSGMDGGYPTYFPNWNDNDGSSVEELLHRYTPASTLLDKSPINEKGEFVAWDGTVLWSAAGGASSGAGPVLVRSIEDQTLVEGAGRRLIDLAEVFSGARSYSVSGSSSVRVNGPSLEISDADPVAGASVAVTATNANGSVTDTFVLTVRQGSATETPGESDPIALLENVWDVSEAGWAILDGAPRNGARPSPRSRRPPPAARR